MTIVSITVSDVEEAAIAALLGPTGLPLGESATAFVNRHVRHQLDFVLSLLPTDADRLAAADAATKAAVAALLKDVKVRRGA